MCVHGDTSKLWGWHEAVPVAQRLERIMDESKCVALLGGAKGIAKRKYVQRIVITSQRKGGRCYRMFPYESYQY